MYRPETFATQSGASILRRFQGLFESFQFLHGEYLVEPADAPLGMDFGGGGNQQVADEIAVNLIAACAYK